MASLKIISMKNILVLLALISCIVCNSQESAVEVHQGNINTQKKKSYLQGQIENPNSKLYNAENSNDITASNRKYGSVDLKGKDRGEFNDETYYRNLEELSKKADEVIYQVSQNETLKEILAQEKKDEQLLYNISKEKESEIKQIISQRVKINQLKIEEAENKIFRNKITDYSILLIVALLSVFIIIRIIKLINFREISNNIKKIQEYNIKTKLPKLSRNEIYLISFSTGAILSMILGNLMPSHDYYRLSRKQGQAIKVSEGLSTYSIESFNYSIAIITFLLVSLTFYFILTKANDKK